MHQGLELAAVIASAVYGVLLARRHEMDLVGAYSLALVVSFGGGTIRDLCLDRTPLFWIHHYNYPIVVFAIAVAGSLFPNITHQTEPWLRVPDALGLGLFTIAGVDSALEAETSFFIAALFGVITGTFGGVIGDIICNQVPSLFRPAPMFATCAFSGAWLYLLLQAVPGGQRYAVVIATAFIVIFRMAAVRYDWRLPHRETECNQQG